MKNKKRDLQDFSFRRRTIFTISPPTFVKLSIRLFVRFRTRFLAGLSTISRRLLPFFALTRAFASSRERRLNIPRAYFGNIRQDVYTGARVGARKSLENKCVRETPVRTGLKRFCGIFPLKVTVAIVLEKLSGTSAGSRKAHKSRDGLSPWIGEGVRCEGKRRRRSVRTKKLEQPVGTLS